MITVRKNDERLREIWRKCLSFVKTTVKKTKKHVNGKKRGEDSIMLQVVQLFKNAHENCQLNHWKRVVTSRTPCIVYAM